MSSISEEYLSSILQKLACINNLQNWRYTVEKFESIGQNYFGIIVPVILFGKRDGIDVRDQCVLKLAPTEEQYRVSGAVTFMFAREIFVYSVLFKAYRNILLHFPPHLQFVIPHCFYVQNEYCKEVIVMQNMFEIGFKPFTHQIFLDVDHIVVSLKALAKFHSLSFKIKYENSTLFNEIFRTCVPLNEKTGKRYMDIMRNRLEQAQKVFAGTKYMPLLHKLKDNCADIFDSVVNSVQKTCLCHGDIWKENILFKYEDNKPISACLIDYQSARISCAAFDTLYLIISSTSTELRQNYYGQLLDTYYQTFDQMLRIGGLDAEQVYSRQMFDQDLKVVAPACVVTANCALWLSNGLQEEGHVRSKIVWSTQEEKEQALIKYRGIVKAIIDDCCKYGYMSL